MNQHFVNVAKIDASLGAFALDSSAASPLLYLPEIIKSIAGNLATNFVAKYYPVTLNTGDKTNIIFK